MGRGAKPDKVGVLPTRLAGGRVRRERARFGRMEFHMHAIYILMLDIKQCARLAVLDREGGAFLVEADVPGKDIP